jgi:hypothetical protein
MAAGLVGCTNAIRNQSMTGTTKQFKSFLKYWSKIIFWDGAIPITTSTSYPVPVRRDGKVQIAFMVCPYVFNGKGSWIRPPNKVVLEDPISGKFITEYSVSPDYFGQMDDADEKLEGNLSIPSDMGEVFRNSREHLFMLYDVLFEAWTTAPSVSSNSKLQDEAREFLKTFDMVSEKPLRPYYNALGYDWFGWLRGLLQ